MNLYRQFCLRYSKKVSRPKWIIYKHISDKSKKCLSGILSIVVDCVFTPAYTSLCRGLKYLLKVRYIILDPLRDVWKIKSQKWAVFAFGSHILTKLSQNVCLNNTHIWIWIYWHATCDCNLWNALWFYCIYKVFSYIIIDHSYLNCCISAKLSLIKCLISTRILIYRHARCDSK